MSETAQGRQSGAEQEPRLSKEEKRAMRAQRYERLHANVKRRRLAYGLFIPTAIVVFLVSIVDILFLDQALFWGVIAAYVILLVWGILLLFSRRKEYEVISTALEKNFLRCRTCQHVFEFDMQHQHDGRRAVVFTCPDCGEPGRLPVDDSNAVPAAVPSGGAFGSRFRCDECGEHWRVSSLGHAPKVDIQFEACPHCGAKHSMELMEGE